MEGENLQVLVSGIIFAFMTCCTAMMTDAHIVDDQDDETVRDDDGDNSNESDTSTGIDLCTEMIPKTDIRNATELASGFEGVMGSTGSMQIAVHKENVYFLDGDNSLLMVNREGGELNTVVTGHEGMQGLMVDGNYLYWKEGYYEDGQLARMRLPGGEVEYLGDARSVTAIERIIDFDEDNIYWIYFDLDDSSIGGQLIRAPKSGGDPEPIISQREVPGSIAVDNRDIFWTELQMTTDYEPDWDYSWVYAMPKDGGEVRMLAEHQPRPMDLVVSDTMVFWANQGSTEFPGYESIGYVPKNPDPGQMEYRMLIGLESPERLVVDSNYLYSDGFGIFKTTFDWCELRAREKLNTIMFS